MTKFFLIRVADKYLGDNGEGVAIIVDIENAYLFPSKEDASKTAPIITNEQWVIEELPEPPIIF